MDETELVKGKIITKGLLTERIVRLKIKNIEPMKVDYKTGQYVTLRISESEHQPYYISNYLKEINAFEIVADLKKDEPGTNYIKSVGVGDDLVYSHPQGELLLDDNEEEYYFIAEGTYVSPFLAFLYQIDKSFKKPTIHMFWEVREEKELFLVNTIYAFSTTTPSFSYDIFISEGTSTIRHRPGRVIDALNTVQFKPGVKICLCGESTMVGEASAILKTKGIPKENIIFEKIKSS